MYQAPDSKIHVKWNTGKDQDRSVYDTKLIELENGTISTYEGESCSVQLQMRFPYRPGTSTPETADREGFQMVASRIKPSKEVENVLPSGSYTCIHIRGKDKIVENDNGDFLMTSKAFYEYAKNKTLEYVKSHSDKPYFVCSDDDVLKKEFIKECGEDVKFIGDINYGTLDPSIVDFFAMTRAELIIQCTRYSTFSIAASIVGKVPLINFDERTVMGRDDWNWGPFVIRV
jgi:hypothetical protein